MIKKLFSAFNMKPKNIRVFIVGMSFFLLFLILSVTISQGFAADLDPNLTASLQRIIPRQFDLALSLFTLMGSIEMTTLILLTIGILFYKKFKQMPFSLCLFAVIMVIEYIGKILIHHPGPPKIFFRYALPFSTPSYIGSSFSFPSGHVGRTSFIVVLSIFLAQKFLTGRLRKFATISCLLLYLLIMSVSRVYLGEHWTSDVLGGIILGSAMGLFAVIYY